MDGVDPVLAQHSAASDLAGYALIPGSQQGDKFGGLFCCELLVSCWMVLTSSGCSKVRHLIWSDIIVMVILLILSSWQMV